MTIKEARGRLNSNADSTNHQMGQEFFQLLVLDGASQRLSWFQEKETEQFVRDVPLEGFLQILN